MTVYLFIVLHALCISIRKYIDSVIFCFQCYWLFTHFLLYSSHWIFLSGQHTANVGNCVWRRRKERFYWLAITWHGEEPIWGKIIYHKKINCKICDSTKSPWQGVLLELAGNYTQKSIIILYTNSNFQLLCNLIIRGVQLMAMVKKNSTYH